MRLGTVQKSIYAYVHTFQPCTIPEIHDMLVHCPPKDNYYYHKSKIYDTIHRMIKREILYAEKEKGKYILYTKDMKQFIDALHFQFLCSTSTLVQSEKVERLLKEAVNCDSDDIRSSFSFYLLLYAFEQDKLFSKLDSY